MRDTRRGIWLGALAGVLIASGFGLIPFGVFVWIWMHHMFIVGIRSWSGVVALLSVPLLLTAAGVLLLFKLLHNKAN